MWFRAYPPSGPDGKAAQNDEVEARDGPGKTAGCNRLARIP